MNDRRVADRAFVGRIVRRLEAVFGRPVWRRRGSGLDALVATLLSQSTSDTNSSRACGQLETAFPARSRQRRTSGAIDWNAVADAPRGRLERVIRCAGLWRTKSRRIRTILRQIRTGRGELSLEFLQQWPVARARDYLLGFDGIGPKTAACILLFSFHLPILPVDTHIHRVAGRLGLIGRRVSAEASHAALEAIVPPGQFYSFHVLMIRLGRRICRARRPRCHECALGRLCRTGPVLIRTGRSGGSADRPAICRGTSTHGGV